MMQKFIIRDFKSYKEATLHLSPLSVLIGANASGKSNAIEALRLLSWMAQGQKLTALLYQVNREDQIVRGFVKDLPRRSLHTFSFESKVLFQKRNINHKISVKLRTNLELHVEYERCYENSDFLFLTKSASRGSSTDMKVEYNNFRKGGNKPQITVTDQQAVFYQLTNEANFNINQKATRKRLPKVASYLEKTLSNMLFLDPNPQLMRDYSHKSNVKLAESGGNISSVLFHLLKGDDSNKKQVLAFIESLPEQEIKDIEFYETPRGEVMIQLKEAFGTKTGRLVDASLLSDGTLRVLAIVAALMSATEGCLVVIEEIDNGIHPSRVKELMSRINDLARERKLSILITSHNPALLNAIPIESIPDVQFCYRSKKDGCSQLIRLQDIKNYPELVAQDEIGNLLTRGLIDKYVKDETTSEDKVKKGLDWLKAFEDEQ